MIPSMTLIEMQGGDGGKHLPLPLYCPLLTSLVAIRKLHAISKIVVFLKFGDAFSSFPDAPKDVDVEMKAPDLATLNHLWNVHIRDFALIQQSRECELLGLIVSNTDVSICQNGGLFDWRDFCSSIEQNFAAANPVIALSLSQNLAASSERDDGESAAKLLFANILRFLSQSCNDGLLASSNDFHQQSHHNVSKEVSTYYCCSWGQSIFDASTECNKEMDIVHGLRSLELFLGSPMFLNILGGLSDDEDNTLTVFQVLDEILNIVEDFVLWPGSGNSRSVRKFKASASAILFSLLQAESGVSLAAKCCQMLTGGEAERIHILEKVARTCLVVIDAEMGLNLVRVSSETESGDSAMDLSVDEAAFWGSFGNKSDIGTERENDLSRCLDLLHNLQSLMISCKVLPHFSPILIAVSFQMFLITVKDFFQVPTLVSQSLSVMQATVEAALGNSGESSQAMVQDLCDAVASMCHYACRLEGDIRHVKLALPPLLRLWVILANAWNCSFSPGNYDRVVVRFTNSWLVIWKDLVGGATGSLTKIVCMQTLTSYLRDSTQSEPRKALVMSLLSNISPIIMSEMPCTFSESDGDVLVELKTEQVKMAILLFTSSPPTYHSAGLFAWCCSSE
jgi:hypothetical protein